ncbi:23S rRNA (pseudouridine(1915)-N(3))-methyltransferase RlmH [Mycoplasmopsis primatum]|uniref:23S rRNA (pseudouridine(1915)-N(3))-methyltransferase RlmH n=1 Tax=Mycoplasmopsis primatum TaxID=55604 RepID=UPI00049720B8|nr:23S rRNA (pseudouridine(1915)-N(3))-methyltransferase RlmH [Mycoplasmopsis primatum]
MTKIKIIAVGSLSPIFNKLFEEYQKQVNRFCELSIIEIKELSDEKNIESKKSKETKLILDKISSNSLVVLLSMQGNQIESEKFANLLKENQNKNLTFIIGGSDGVDEKQFNKCLKISFSKMTFPHQLFRIMLIEQIYRGFMILNNTKYHK